MHSVAADCSVAEVGAQRRSQGGGVGGRATTFKLFGNELAHVGRLQRVDHNRTIGELVQQQEPYGTQPPAARFSAQAACLVHVLVVPAQFVGNVADICIVVAAVWLALSQLVGGGQGDGDEESTDD